MWVRMPFLAMALLGAFFLGAGASAQGEKYEIPDQERVLVESEGRYQYGALQNWDWTAPPDAVDGCCGISGVRDYAYNPDPIRLPTHRGGRIKVRTGRPTASVKVQLGGRGRFATQTDRRGRRWAVDLPYRPRRPDVLRLTVEYRDPDGSLGRFVFLVDVRQHDRH